MRHLVLLSVICVKIYRNIQILEYRFDIGRRVGNQYNSLTSFRVQGSYKTTNLSTTTTLKSSAKMPNSEEEARIEESKTKIIISQPSPLTPQYQLLLNRPDQFPRICLNIFFWNRKLIFVFWGRSLGVNPLFIDS